jgi:hypothetical protein
MPSNTYTLLDDISWILLWIVICCEPIVFWVSLWLLLPSIVCVALLSVGPAAGFLVTCWYGLSRHSRLGHMWRPIVSSRLPRATSVPLMTEWNHTDPTYVSLS